MNTTIDRITVDGKVYTAVVRKSDRKDFAAPCESFGTKRCALHQPHDCGVDLAIDGDPVGCGVHQSNSGPL